MQKPLIWGNHPEIQEKFDILFEEQGYTLKECAEFLTDEFGRTFTENQLSRRRYNAKGDNNSTPILKQYFDDIQEDIVNNRSVESMASGEVRAKGDIVFADDELITADKLMKAFGYDPNEFVVTTSGASVRDSVRREDDKKIYSCRISVKRKVVPMSTEQMGEIINEISQFNVDKRIDIDYTKNTSTLVIPIYDKHFGISDLAHYKGELAQILSYIESRQPQSIILALGGDLFHNDSIVHGTTTKGTFIDKVDMFEAIRDFKEYFHAIITKALEVAEDVIVVGVAGNHDTTIGQLVTEMLEAKYPQAEWVIPKTEFELWRRAIVVNGVFFGFTHGDSARANIDRVFSNEFPKEWGNADTREVFIGHLHSKKTKQWVTENVNGVTIREMPSANLADGYHMQNAYTGSMHETMLFLYEDGHIKEERHIHTK